MGTFQKVKPLSFTPKLHLLTHCVEFVKVHHNLGRFGESGIEHQHKFTRRLIIRYPGFGDNSIKRQEAMLHTMLLNQLITLEFQSL